MLIYKIENPALYSEHSKEANMLGTYTHDIHLQAIAHTHLESIQKTIETEHLLRQARLSWRRQLARTLLHWASKLEPEVRGMTTRAA